MQPVCLVIGAGAGIGGNVGKRFARVKVFMCVFMPTQRRRRFAAVSGRNPSRRRQCFGLHPKRGRRRHY